MKKNTKGITLLALIPMRKEPSDRSEMVNQVLYGETFSILEKQEKWSRIRLSHDRYEGWIDNKQYVILSSSQTLKNNSVVAQLFLRSGKQILPMGAFAEHHHPKKFLKDLIGTAKQFLETPYLWGGRSFMGIDCSGFTQVVFRVHGISIPRDAYQQAEKGKKIKWEDAQSGDLAFFANDKGKVTHVGIIIQQRGSTHIIHASGKVRIDVLDSKGIYKEEINGYSHFLHSIKRIA